MLSLIFLATFLFTVHFALLLYVHSSFITQFISPGAIEPLYIASSILSIILLATIPRMLRSHGQWRTSLMLIITALVASAGMAQTKNPLMLGALFAILYAVQNTIRLDLDVYIEKFSRDATTGFTRGLFLTITNIGVAATPFITGKLIAQRGITLPYTISALVLIPVFLIMAFPLSRVAESRYKTGRFAASLKKLWRKKDLRRISLATILLEFFYAWMVIYTPIYLHQTIGFSWEEIGAILSVMLLAFPLFQLPAGYIADKYLGEKELLVFGFLVMGSATFSLPFLTLKSVPLWIALLFATRIGASLVEIMTETYFFKKVRGEDTDLMSVFRYARPLAYIAAAPLGAAILFLSGGDYRIFFILLGALMVFGVAVGLRIRDTR